MRFKHIVACICNLFFLTAELYCIVWVYHNLFMYSPVENNLDYFQPLDIMKKVLQLFAQDIFSFLSGKYLGIELLNFKLNIDLSL